MHAFKVNWGGLKPSAIKREFTGYGRGIKDAASTAAQGAKTATRWTSRQVPQRFGGTRGMTDRARVAQRTTQRTADKAAVARKAAAEAAKKA